MHCILARRARRRGMMSAVYEYRPPPPTDDSWFKRHRGLGFLLAAGATLVVPLGFVVGVGAVVSISTVVLTHFAAAAGGALIGWAFCQARGGDA